jgi:hypothetical protein
MRDNEVFNSDYKVPQNDRRGVKKGGGVFMAVKQDIITNNVRLGHDKLKVLCVQVKLYSEACFIFTVYSACPFGAENCMSYYKLFETREHFQNNNLIIDGDFNLLLITGSDRDLLNGGPCCGIYANFLHVYSLYCSDSVKMAKIKHLIKFLQMLITTSL